MLTAWNRRTAKMLHQDSAPGAVHWSLQRCVAKLFQPQFTHGQPQSPPPPEQQQQQQPSVAACASPETSRLEAINANVPTAAAATAAGSGPSEGSLADAGGGVTPAVLADRPNVLCMWALHVSDLDAIEQQLPCSITVVQPSADTIENLAQVCLTLCWRYSE